MNMIAEAKRKAGDQAKIEKEEWIGDVLHFALTAQGQHLAGTFEVKDSEYLLNLKLPFYLRPFEKKIKSAILEQAKTALQGTIDK